MLSTKKLSSLIASLVLVFALTPTFAGDLGKIKIASDAEYPPFGYKDAKGDIVGFDVEITLAACAAAKLDCEFVAQAWDGIIPGLLVKKYHAISASMTATDERRKQISFTDKTYSLPSRWLVKKGSTMTFDAAGLSGKTVAAQRSSVQADYLNEKFEKNSTVNLYETQDQANLDLAAGRVDALLGEVLALTESFLSTDAGKKFEFQGPELKFGDGVAIGLRKEDSELRERFNAGIKAIRESGEYQKISTQYFNMDIY